MSLARETTTDPGRHVREGSRELTQHVVHPIMPQPEVRPMGPMQEHGGGPETIAPVERIRSELVGIGAGTRSEVSLDQLAQDAQEAQPYVAVISEVGKEIQFTAAERVEEALKVQEHFTLRDHASVALDVAKNTFFPSLWKRGPFRDRFSSFGRGAEYMGTSMVLGSLIGPISPGLSKTIIVTIPYLRDRGVKMLKTWWAMMTTGKMPQFKELTEEDIRLQGIMAADVQSTFDRNLRKTIHENPRKNPYAVADEMQDEMFRDRVKPSGRISHADRITAYIGNTWGIMKEHGVLNTLLHLPEVRRHIKQQLDEIPHEAILEQQYQVIGMQEQRSGQRFKVKQSLLYFADQIAPRLAYGLSALVTIFGLSLGPLHIAPFLALGIEAAVAAAGWPAFVAIGLTAVAGAVMYRTFRGITNIAIHRIPEAREKVALKKLGKTKEDLVREYNEKHPFTI